MSDLLEVERLANELPPRDQLALIQHLASRLTVTIPVATATPVSLFGILKGQIPEDFDVEKAIREARDEWKRKMENLDDARNPD